MLIFEVVIFYVGCGMKRRLSLVENLKNLKIWEIGILLYR